ncbi:hypothetical protein BJX63DRAFT_57810 [Aspergillus granulosus]|uniref:ML-like domain-containing protein n=1 Tax=Aspergillus granulosus TaxID=176169 RepID=A0ABR4HSW8_9EURO
MRLLLLSISYAFLMTRLPCVIATRLIETNALDIVSPGNFSATHFSALFTPDNRTAAVRIIGETLITGYVTADVNLVVYGFKTDKQTINPCKIDYLKGFCPMNAGPLELTATNIRIENKTLGAIPAIAYTVPDIDAIVRIEVKSKATGEQITIVEAALSNGQTTYQAAVGWIVAVISGIGLALSAILPILREYSDSIACLGGYTFSLFGFVQSQAMIGMLAVPMPPIVQSWTQNFQWSQGVVHAEFLETICTWYLRSTGGTADELFAVLSTHMVNVLRKREEITATSPATNLAKRSNTMRSSDIVVRGLTRVAFRAQIEETNLFLNAIIVFTFVALVIMILIGVWKATQLHPRMRTTQLQWKSIAKGLLHRVYFLAFLPICIFSLWELTQRDSPAEIIIAIVAFLSIVSASTWAVTQVILTQNRALAIYRSPVSALFSDTATLNNYGFLYTHYGPQAPYFAAITLSTLFVKALFVSFAQSSPRTQSVAFLIIDAAMLITVSIIRPWVDRKSNAVNITIYTINFLHSIFVLFFSGVFDQPRMISSIMGVILFVTSAALILVLLAFVFFYSVRTVLEGRYPGKPFKPMSEVSGPSLPMRSSARLTGNHAHLDDLSTTSQGAIKQGSMRSVI